MTLAGAIADLQTKALAMTSVTIKAATGPIESTNPFPFFIAYLASGASSEENVGKARVDYVVRGNFYFNRTNLIQAYSDVNAIGPEYLRKLASDPTLSGTCDSVVHPSFETLDDVWDASPVVVVSFTVPVKIRETPA